MVYIPAEGLTNEDIAEYAAGTTRSMPGDPCTVFVGLHKSNHLRAEAESALENVAYGTSECEIHRVCNRMSMGCSPGYTIYFRSTYT